MDGPLPWAHNLTMPLSLAELDHRLASLDGAMVMLMVEYPDRDELMAAFASRADEILEEAGEHRPHVVARLETILATHGLLRRG